MRDVFISYSSTDVTEAYSVRDYLKNNGCTCWMAPDNIPAGSDYAEAIPKAIADCRVFVLILTPDAQNSSWVRKEVGKAVDKGKTVIPFILRDFKLNDTYDFLLENAQWCYAYKNRNEALQKMLITVKAMQSTYSYTPSSSAPKQTTTATKQSTYSYTPSSSTSTPKQSTYSYTPSSSATKQTTAAPKQTPAAPRQTASAPKQTVSSSSTAPKYTTTSSTSRSAGPKYGNSKAISRFIYCLTTWGTFWTLTGLLLALSSVLSEHTTMGSGAYAIAGLGMPAAIILLCVAHKKDWINDGIRAAKKGSVFQKFLLWLVLGMGILIILVIIGGLTYLQLASQESFTPVQMAILAIVSGALSLAIVTGWLKRYTF